MSGISDCASFITSALSPGATFEESSAFASAALQVSKSSRASPRPLCDSFLVRPRYEHGPPVFSQMKSAMLLQSGPTLAAGSALKPGPMRGPASASVQNPSTRPAQPFRPYRQQQSHGAGSPRIEAHQVSSS